MSAIKFNLNLQDFHRAHRNRKHKVEDTANWKEFKTIINTLGDILGDELVKKGKVKMPNSTWQFKIIKVKNTYIDKKSSRELGTEIRQFNDHSDGFSCKIILAPDSTLSKKKNLYLFKGTRSLKRNKLRDTIRKHKNIIYSYDTIELKSKEQTK